MEGAIVEVRDGLLIGFIVVGLIVEGNKVGKKVGSFVIA